MAKYRQLHTEFWNDGFVLDLTPEEKYFYIYLMTNSNTTQCGIYELPKRIIETQTGYNRETVDKLLKRFKEYQKISYCEETKEIIILNWIKYNQPNNSNAIKCVNKELKTVKNKEFILILYNQCVNQQLDIEAIFDCIHIESSISNENKSFSNFNKPLTSDYEGSYKGLVSKEVINKKEEITSNKEEAEIISKNGGIVEAAPTSVEDVLVFFEKNICKPKDMEYSKILSWGSSISPDVIIMAIEEAVNYNAKNIKYIENIINSWMKKGLKTRGEVEVYKRIWERKKKGSSKIISSWDYKQRDYDFKELERKLLGWNRE